MRGAELREARSAIAEMRLAELLPPVPGVTPDAVERWLRDLGLDPGARTEREGLAAWDLVLDGRRRHDLRVTVILDPSLGAIVWAHLAPPIGDALRKTYRTLLRWNDDFPLAKFSIADDGRPILAVEVPSRWLDADELGLAWPGSSRSPTASSTGPRAGSGSAAASRPAMPSASPATPRCSSAIGRRWASWSSRPSRRAGRAGGAARAGPGVMRVRAFALARLLSAVLLASTLLVGGGPAASTAPVAVAATPSLTLVTDATYTVKPTDHKVAISVAITATNHLHDTTTKHTTTGPPTSMSCRRRRGSSSRPVAARRASVSRRTASSTLLRLDLGSNLGAGATRKLTLTFDLKDPGGAPDRPIRISPSLVAFYTWAFASPSTPGSTVAVTFPAGYNVTIGRGPLTGPSTAAGGAQTWHSGDAPTRHCRSSPTCRRTIRRTTSTSPGPPRSAGWPRASSSASWPDDTPWRKRVGDLVTKACPCSAMPSACRGRSRPDSSSRRRSSAGPAGMPACSIRAGT